MSNTNLRMSVIIPVYNPGGYFPACLESLTSQTIFPRIEVVLVDDGSTDGSQDLCDDFASAHGNVKVIHQSNKGLSVARNVGMDAACGDYFLFLDSDDSLVADACERLLEAAETSGGDIICGDHVGKEVCVGSAAEFAQSGQPVELWRYLKRLLLEGTYAHSPLFRLVRSGFTRENGISFAEGIIFEEHTWVMRLLLHGASVLRVDFPYYIYNVGDHPSLSTTVTAKRLMDAIDSINLEIDELEAADVPDEVREVAETFIANAIAVLAIAYLGQAPSAYREIVRLRIDDRFARYAERTQHLPDVARTIGPAFVHDPELFKAERDRLHKARQNLGRHTSR